MRLLFQFALATALTSLAPLVCLSVTAHLHGTEAFLALALGQAVGGLTAIISTWGWDVNGPQRIAPLSDGDAATELLRSVRTRGFVYGILAVPSAVIAWQLSGSGYSWLAGLTALAVGSQAMNPSWWCSGRRTPRDLLKVESYPRAMTAGASAALIALGLTPSVYPAMTLAVMLPIYVYFYRARLTLADRSAQNGMVAELQANVRGTGIAILGSFYSTALLPLVQVFVPGAALLFATGQRLVTYANLATITFANAFMGSRADVLRRRSMAVMIYASFVLAAALSVAAPTLSRLLFDIELGSWQIAVLVSAIYLGVAVNTAISKLWLIPEGHERRVIIAVAIAAVVGPPLTVVLAHSNGALGGLTGMLAAEIAFCAVCLLPRQRRLSGPSEAPA